jgi:hypothetical protein
MVLNKQFAITFVFATILSFIVVIIFSDILFSQPFADDHSVVLKARDLHKLLQDPRVGSEARSNAVKLDHRSQEAFKQGNYKEALRFIEEAITAINIDILSAGARENTGIQKPSSMTLSDERAGKDSPFGIHDPKIPELDNVEDVAEVGAKWVRYAGRNGIVWDMIEPESRNFNWAFHDQLFLRTYQSGIRMNVVILGFNRRDQKEFGFIPKNFDNYLRFLKTVVERYSGNGVNSAPGSPVVDVWEIENEPDFRHVVPHVAEGWQDSPANYALLLKKSYEVIKKANPKAKVAFAGLTEPAGIDKYFILTLDALEKIKESKESKYFDIAGFHWAGLNPGDYKKMIFPKGTYSIAASIKKMKYELEKRGYKDTPIWIGEMSSNDGLPHGLPFLKQSRSEREQAIEMFKLYINSLANGAAKIFWVTLTEWNNFTGRGQVHYWDKVGLIHNPLNTRLSHKKLSYYTYKKMTETLEGSDWKITQVIKERDGVCLYKFIRKGNPVWVAWNDANESQKITITGISASKVTIVEALPAANSGAQVAEYGSAFKPRIIRVKDGELTLSLGATPLIIEG